MLSLAPLESKYLNQIINFCSNAERNERWRHALAEVTVVELECQMGGCVTIIVDSVHIGASAQASLHHR